MFNASIMAFSPSHKISTTSPIVRQVKRIANLGDGPAILTRTLLALVCTIMQTLAC